LIYFKYLNFLILNIENFINIPIIKKDIIIPIGISFFIFQGLSYSIDVYRNETKAQKKFTNLALYISLFPQLIAGPIVKYHDIQSELESREYSLKNFSLGIERFVSGLGKKVILANSMGLVADKIFSLNIKEMNSETAWLGIICYSFQLYYDFSSYSDMAIGLGKMFGFNFLENFNFPYKSLSVSEF